MESHALYKLSDNAIGECVIHSDFPLFFELLLDPVHLPPPHTRQILEQNLQLLLLEHDIVAELVQVGSEFLRRGWFWRFGGFLGWIGGLLALLGFVFGEGGERGLAFDAGGRGLRADVLEGCVHLV